jgi:hypothetical protein
MSTSESATKSGLVRNGWLTHVIPCALAEYSMAGGFRRHRLNSGVSAGSTWLRQRCLRYALLAFAAQRHRFTGCSSHTAGYSRNSAKVHLARAKRYCRYALLRLPRCKYADDHSGHINLVSVTRLKSVRRREQPQQK